MLTGGYGNNKFFTKNTRDLFIAPQSRGTATYGIGWWREADDKRVWYFGTQSPESTIGHQGWTGTLTMIDFERIAYNKMYGTKWSYGEYTYLKREKKLLPIPTVQF